MTPAPGRLRNTFAAVISLGLVRALGVSACSEPPAVTNPAPDASLAADGDASLAADGDASLATDSDASLAADGDAGMTSDSSADAGVCASGARCDGLTGLCAATATCKPNAVCNDGIVGITPTVLSNPLTVPTCSTSDATRPFYDDGPPQLWTDPVTGEQRAACVYVPPTATQQNKLPIVVYLHGAGGSASAVYDRTSLREKALTTNLTTDLGRRGFFLVANQGRNLVGENGNPAAARHDMYYRNLANHPDVRAIDKLIDDLVATGTADPKRIYVTGWSNGAFFGQLYGLLRHAAPTNGGNRIASVVAFDGADPYQAPSDGAVGCALTPYPKSSLPVMLIHRACSIVPCNAAQKAALVAPPGFDVSAWESTLQLSIQSSDVENVMVGVDGKLAAQCTPAGLCSKLTATKQHILWPDGFIDGGTDFEPRMLGYMRTHPLP
jgi:poly(3-hydroxybutyrate) depolymerase